MIYDQVRSIQRGDGTPGSSLSLRLLAETTTGDRHGFPRLAMYIHNCHGAPPADLTDEGVRNGLRVLAAMTHELLALMQQHRDT